MSFAMGKFENNGFKTKRLLNYATDLTQMAMEGKLDPVIGRSKEIERVQQILCQRRKNNPCLLGNPGVGKTAIVEGLAQKIVNETVPLNLQGIKVFALETGRLVARTRYRGEIEERLVEVIEEVKESDGEIILFIDDVHTLIGDCHFPRSFDVANILKSALSRGDIKCIAATTVKEYQDCIEHDQALQRRFQQVDVPEPTVDETIEILKGLRKKYEDFHRITYEVEALVAASALSKKYISCGVLPDMAIDLIDEAGAKAQLRRNSVNRNSSDKAIVSKNVINFKRNLVRERDIHLIISTRTGIPIHQVSED